MKNDGFFWLIALHRPSPPRAMSQKNFKKKFHRPHRPVHRPLIALSLPSKKLKVDYGAQFEKIVYYEGHFKKIVNYEGYFEKIVNYGGQFESLKK